MTTSFRMISECLNPNSSQSRICTWASLTHRLVEGYTTKRWTNYAIWSQDLMEKAGLAKLLIRTRGESIHGPRPEWAIEDALASHLTSRISNKRWRQRSLANSCSSNLPRAPSQTKSTKATARALMECNNLWSRISRLTVRWQMMTQAKSFFSQTRIKIRRIGWTNTPSPSTTWSRGRMEAC